MVKDDYVYRNDNGSHNASHRKAAGPFEKTVPAMIPSPFTQATDVFRELPRLLARSGEQEKYHAFAISRTKTNTR